MSQKEFLEELRTALSGKLSAQAVLENIEYYRNYIEGAARSGKSEAQVLEMLGDPWILSAGLFSVSTIIAAARFIYNRIIRTILRI